VLGLDSAPRSEGSHPAALAGAAGAAHAAGDDDAARELLDRPASSTGRGAPGSALVAG